MNVDLIIERFGLVGLCLVGLGFAVLILWRRLSEVQDARIADAERHADRLQRLSGEARDAIHEANASIDKLSEIIRDRRNV